MPLHTIKVKEIIPLTSLGGSGGSTSVLVDVSGYSLLTLWYQLQATTVTGDLLAFISLVKPDGTQGANGLNQIRNSLSSDGANVNDIRQYDVSGLQTVRVTINNQNVGSKNGFVQMYLGA